MRNLNFFILLHLISFGGFAQTWTTQTSTPGSAYDYQGGIAFELHGKVYVGGGYYSKSFYMYDPITDTWTAKANLPGCAYSRYQGIGFSINGYGYTAFGEDNYTASGTYTKLTDIWKYNDTTDSWSLAPAFPGLFRFAASVFVVNNKAYIIGGADSANFATNETWEFDGAAWTQKSNYPQSNIAGTATFVLNGKGYSVGGFKATTSFGVYLSNTYQYDPATDTWTSKATFPGSGRADFFGFSTLSKGYCGLGSSLNTSTFTFTYYKDIYAYDDVTDTWSLANANFPGASRQQGFAASLGNYGYIGGGYSYILATETFFTDWYKFSETSTGINETKNFQSGFSIYPNPTCNIINFSKPIGNFSIFNKLGILVENIYSTNAQTQFDIGDLPCGSYFIRSDKNIRFKFLKTSDN